MWLRRQLGLDERLEQADVLPDPQRPMVEDTSYGETAAKDTSTARHMHNKR